MEVPGNLPASCRASSDLPGTGRTGNTDDVCSHSSDGGVISVYNPRTASTRPSTVKGCAWAATAIPRSRAVSVVIGPMEATRTPASEPAPAGLHEILHGGGTGEGDRSRARCAKTSRDAVAEAFGRHGAIGLHHIDVRAAPASSTGTRSRATAARGSRTRLPARSCGGEGLEQALGDVLLAHQIDLQVERFDGGARGRADGADLGAQRAQVGGGAVQRSRKKRTPLALVKISQS